MKKVLFFITALLCSTILLAQPANDNVCDALLLVLDNDCSSSLPYTNVGATVESGEPEGSCYGEGTIEQTVWFSFVAPSTGAVSVDTDFTGSGMQDNQITVFEYDAGQTFDCTTLSNYLEIACNEDKLPEASNTDFNAALPPILVTAGNTYYIQVDGYNDGTAISEGSFCIVVSSVTPPSNDDCATAAGYGGFGPSCTKIWGDNMPNPESATTIGATAGNINLAESCDGTGINASVYYSFLTGVPEVEFNLLSGENINVTLYSSSESCDDPDDGSVELTGNCFTNINTSDNADPMDADILFSDLAVGTTYLMAIWTNEGQETDFSFCLTRAPAYECGDNVCYDLAESYNNCESDCPCESNLDFISYTTGAVSSNPTGVCAEIIGGTSDPANPGIYVPFTVTTLDSDLTGSSISTSAGSLFTSNTALASFGVITPLVPLPNNEANSFVNYVFLTDTEIAAGGIVVINFTSDNGACNASIDLNLANLQAPASSDCGNCTLVVTPDYSTVQCPDLNTALIIEGAVGDLWLSQNNTTIFDSGDEAGAGNNDIALPYAGGYPEGDFTLIIYDSGQPNCAFPLTIFTGDFYCDPENDDLQTVCRVEPSLDPSTPATCNADGSLFIPIDLGRVTGAITATPNVILGSGTSSDPYGLSVDLANCSPLDITISDESQVSVSPSVVVNAPASVAGAITDFGTNVDGDDDGVLDFGIDINSLPICGTGGAEVSGNVVLADDGQSVPGSTFCDPMSGGMPTADQCAGIAGNILMIDRGGCSFTNKAENGQLCGAIGVIICNNVADAQVSNMIGDAVFPITIPTIFLSLETCATLKLQIGNGLNMCLGASEIVADCEATFSVDVCNDYSTQACDDNDCSTENDAATVGPDGAEVCACAGTPIVCPAGQSFNTENCACETGAIAGCTDPCDPNYDAAANESDPAACAGYDTTCDDGDCNTSDAYDSAACACVNTAIAPLDCDDGDCNTTDNYDSATCTCVNIPIDPPNCDDMDCSTDDSYDGANCFCINTPITCAAGEFFDIDSCSCQPSTIAGCTDACADNFNPNADEDDGSCNPYDQTCNTDCTAGAFGGVWDAASCACINTTTPVNGCTDAAACNYDAAANCDNGSCSLASTWYADNDGDGFGDPNNSTESCTQPAGFVANNNDDDDTVANEADVPTLSQWGLILLSLILLSITTVTATQRKYSLVNSKGVADSVATIPYFNKQLFKQMLIKSIPLMLMLFVLISFIEDGWFVRNFIGTVLSIGIGVYILHFAEIIKQFDKDMQ